MKITPCLLVLWAGTCMPQQVKTFLVLKQRRTVCHRLYLQMRGPSRGVFPRRSTAQVATSGCAARCAR